MSPRRVPSAAIALFVYAALSACASTPGPSTASTPPAAAQGPALADMKFPERAVRRDLPVSPALRRAYAMGTRDSSGAPGRNYWQQKVDYKIEATLNPSKNQVRASEVITLHNSTPDTLKTVVLRLYQNYFSPRVERNDYVTDITDGVTIESLSVNGSRIVLTDQKQYDLNERLATITPASPILPGATATIETAWRFTVPNVDTTVRGQRMGRYGSYLYQVAQWYPQVAMYDELRGWDTDQYLGNAEFFNQFGSFDVKITAPRGWLIGATGKHENPEQVYSKRTLDRLALAMQVDTTIIVVDANERGPAATASGATLTWHFTAPIVNDFAFAASKDYAFDATHANVPGKGPIPVNVFYLPQHVNYRKNNTAQLARRSVEEHSRFVFPYEFSQSTIVDGPETGMEYPMVIFNGSSLGVTAHEIGHQWFPMMVGSNETRYGFMDEGFVEYTTPVAIATINNTPINWQNRAAGYRRIAGTEIEAPMMWFSDYAGPGYGVQTYSKAEIALNALGGVVGDAAVGKALAEYAVAWKYKHPTPHDFFFSMNKSLGRNLDWFWHAWFFTTGTFDQALESVRVQGDSVLVTVRDNGDLAMPVILRMDFVGDEKGFRTATFPELVWFGGHRSFQTALQLKGKTLRSLSIDWENRFQDLNRDNNVWVSAARTP